MATTADEKKRPVLTVELNDEVQGYNTCAARWAVLVLLMSVVSAAVVTSLLLVTWFASKHTAITVSYVLGWVLLVTSVVGIVGIMVVMSKVRRLVDSLLGQLRQQHNVKIVSAGAAPPPQQPAAVADTNQVTNV